MADEIKEAAVPPSPGYVLREKPEIEKVAKALVAASKELKNPPKTKEVIAGKYSYLYAELSDVIDVVRPVLAKHGLVLLHIMDRLGEGWALTARILHESGQHIDSLYPVPKGISGAQEIGSWLTYMRRYSTCNMLFLAGETDDDGTKATEAEQTATDQEALEERRKKADKNLDQAKAEGRIKSAHTGKVLKPGESPEAQPDPTHNPDLEPVPEPESTEDWSDIPPKLAEAMKKEQIAPSTIRTVLGPKPDGFGIVPAGMKLDKLPADKVEKLVAGTNWQMIVERSRK